MVKVLLIETNAKIQSQLVEALKKVRFDVTTTNWAADGLSLVKETCFDLVLIRFNLEDMSASEFTQSLRKNPEHTHFPIVVIYGKMDSKQRMEAWRSGADDVISMPFILPEVLMQLHIRLQKTNLHRNLSVPLNLRSQEETSRENDANSESLPGHGTISSRPFPVILSSLFFNRATGTLRMIEGKYIRSIYFENGFIRGASSSHKDEKIHRLMLKWVDFPGETKRHFKSLPETTSDEDITAQAAKLCGLQKEAIDAVAVRYMHYVIQGATLMTKGEFDWSANETPSDVCLVGFRGLHPVHLLLTVIRDTSPPPSYDHVIFNKEFKLAPSPNEGLLRNTFRMTAPEACVMALTASGITLGNWLKQSRIILPYAEAFIYVMLVFRIFSAVERAELDPDEIAAVALPPISTIETLESIIDISDDDLSSPDTNEQKQPSSNELNSPPPHVDAHELTDVDLRPVKKRISPQTGQNQQTTPCHSNGKSLLDREIECYKQQTTPHRRYQTLKEDLTDSPEKSKILKPPKVLQLFNLNESHLLQGQTWETHPALIMVLAIKMKQTGILLYSDAASHTRLYWQNGRLLYAKTDKLSLRIDQVLFDLGIINEDQKQDAGNLWEASGGMRSGTGLFKQHIVNVMELTEAVKEQIRLIIQDVCNMPAGEYRFQAGSLPPEEYIAFDISTERVFMQGIRGLEELGNLDKTIPSLNTTWVGCPGASGKAQDMRLEGVDITILNRFRKETTLKAAFAGSDLGLQAFKNTIVGLYMIDLLEMTGNHA
jgi:CheY-like chemotaxis protein